MSPRSPAPTQPHHGHRADPGHGTAADPQVFQTINTERARTSGFRSRPIRLGAHFGGRGTRPRTEKHTASTAPQASPSTPSIPQLALGITTHGRLGTAVSTCATMQRRQPRTSTAHLPSNRPIRNSRFRRRRHCDLSAQWRIPEAHAPEPGCAQPSPTRNTGCGPTSMVWLRHLAQTTPIPSPAAACIAAPGDGFLTLQRRDAIRAMRRKPLRSLESSAAFSRTFYGGAVRSRTDQLDLVIRGITALLPRQKTVPLIKKGSKRFLVEIGAEKSLELSTSTWQGCALPTELIPAFTVAPHCITFVCRKVL